MLHESFFKLQVYCKSFLLHHHPSTTLWCVHLYWYLLSIHLTFTICVSVFHLIAASVFLQLIWYDLIWSGLLWCRLKNVCSVGVCFIPSTFIRLWSIHAFNLLHFAMFECCHFNLKWHQITWASWKYKSQSSSRRTMVPLVERIKNDYGGKSLKREHLCVWRCVHDSQQILKLGKYQYQKELGAKVQSKSMLIQDEVWRECVCSSIMIPVPWDGTKA